MGCKFGDRKHADHIYRHMEYDMKEGSGGKNGDRSQGGSQGCPHKQKTKGGIFSPETSGRQKITEYGPVLE